MIPLTSEYKRHGSELAFKTCPHCGNQRWNYSVNVNKGLWHCWACDRGGPIKGGSLLLSRLPEDMQMEVIARETVQALHSDLVPIPASAIPITQSELGMLSIRKRGMTVEELRKYRILFDESNRSLYVPPLIDAVYGYNERTAKGRWYFHGVDKRDQFYLIHGTSEYLALCEGAFDAFKVARTGMNTFCLFGRVLYENQLERLIPVFHKFVLALDNDKWGMSGIVKIAGMIHDRGGECFCMKPPAGKKDFGECTTDEVMEAYRNLFPLTMSKLLSLRLSLAKNS